MKQNNIILYLSCLSLMDDDSVYIILYLNYHRRIISHIISTSSIVFSCMYSFVQLQLSYSSEIVSHACIKYVHTHVTRIV